MADGRDCRCAARCAAECGCDADWTPQEIYNLRSEVELLRVRIKVLETAIRRLADQDATLSVCGGNVTVTMDPTPDEGSVRGQCTLTDEERADLQMWAAECLRQCSNATEGNDWDAAERWSDRAARAAKMLGRFSQ